VKKLLIVLFILMFASIASAATLKWDASTGEVDGYNVYFTDGVDDFSHPVGDVTEIPDIDDTLNLTPGKTYIFIVTAWNIMGESGPSNEAAYETTAVYTPPENNIPIKITVPLPVIININIAVE